MLLQIVLSAMTKPNVNNASQPYTYGKTHAITHIALILNLKIGMEISFANYVRTEFLTAIIVTKIMSVYVLNAIKIITIYYH